MSTADDLKAALIEQHPPKSWLTQAEAASYVRLCERTFLQGVKTGQFPAGYAASKRRRLWDPRELDAAIKGEKDAKPIDPIMAAIDAATTQAAERRKKPGQGTDVLHRPLQRTADRQAAE
jgi:hypothetical protein